MFTVEAHCGPHVATLSRCEDEREAIRQAQDYRSAHRLFSVYVWRHVTERTRLLHYYQLSN